MPQGEWESAKFLKTFSVGYMWLESCQRGHSYNTVAEPLPDISFLNMDPVEGTSFRDSGQKPMKNTVFLFKTFISAKPTVWEWNIWVLRVWMENKGFQLKSKPSWVCCGNTESAKVQGEWIFFPIYNWCVEFNCPVHLANHRVICFILVCLTPVRL